MVRPLLTLSFFICKMGTVIEWGSHRLMAHLSTVLPGGGRPCGLNFSGCLLQSLTPRMFPSKGSMMGGDGGLVLRA